MFTGLVERTGRIVSLRKRGDGATIDIAASGWDEPLKPGESVAVSGVCLTVVNTETHGFAADVLKETLTLSSLGTKGDGAIVNLERALRAGDRMGGHIVSGHVDGMGQVATIKKTGLDVVLRVSCAPALLDEVVVKGSIALEGISLTVTAVGENWFEVHVIPHTWQETSLDGFSVGDQLNIETDVIAKYVRKYSSQSHSDASILSKLKSAGFA